MFYTHYKKYGNKILFTYVDDDGQKHVTSIDDYKPTLYVTSPDKSQHGDFRSIYGYGLKSIQFDTIKDADRHLQHYGEVDNMRIEGNTRYDNQFVVELFEGKTPHIDETLIDGCILDIEVSAPEFPDPLEAKYEIDLMTIYDIRKDSYLVLSLYDWDRSCSNDYEKELENLNIDFKKVKSEYELLDQFLLHMMNRRYAFTSGWHSRGFDLPYLVQRMEQTLGKSRTKKLSPYSLVKKNTGRDDYNNEILKVSIVGLEDLDYMLLYRKHIFTPQVNYKLETIAQAELHVGKLDHSEEGTLHKLSQINPQKYVSYNIIDVKRVAELDMKLQLFSLTFTLAYYCFCNYSETLKSVGPWECLTAKEFYTRGLVPLSKQELTNFRNYPGGYVADPQIGHHEWVCSFDLNSLYPHIMMQVNISPETYIAEKDLPEELLELRSQLSVKNPTRYYEECGGLVDKKIDLDMLKKYNVSMSANGMFYKRDKQGIFPEINEMLYADRKKIKREMLDKEQELAEINHQLKERGLL